MYQYNSQEIQDDHVDQILKILFQTHFIHELSIKEAMRIFNELDLASMYLLFSLIQERLPKRAKLFFVGESFEGKKEMICEVIQSLYKKNS